MSGHTHYPDDGRWAEVGMRATCVGCRRAILYVERVGRSYWRAVGPFGPQLIQSKRCTSRCPAVGYLTCRMARHHQGSCREGGYVWWRGVGHSRPHLVSRPSWDRGWATI